MEKTGPQEWRILGFCSPVIREYPHSIPVEDYFGAVKYIAIQFFISLKIP